MLSTEIQHFLGFSDTTDQGTGDGFAAHNQFAAVQRRLDWLNQTDQNMGTVTFERVQIRVQIYVD